MKWDINILFDKYWASLCWYAFRCCRDNIETEEIVAEVFLFTFKKIEEFDSEKDIKNYLFTSVKNKCINYVKFRKNKNAEHLLLEIETPPIEEEIIKAEVIKKLYENINKLPTQCCKIIKLSFIEGYKPKEVASILNLSVNTIRNQQMIGKRLLKEMYLG